VTSDRPQDSIAAIREDARAFPGLCLLLLHGSRARGDAHALSDWDFAYESTAGFDPDALLATLADRLKADRIDLVDLTRAGALLRYRVIRGAIWGPCWSRTTPPCWRRCVDEPAGSRGAG